MTLLVLETARLGEALAQAGDEDVLVVDSSAERLERLERETADPRVFYLIGAPDILPLPDRFVDRALGEGADSELERVLRK